MLDIQRISKTFNPGTVNEKKAITDLSLHLNKGEFVTVIGSNGAGKSTLVRCINLLERPTDGSVTVNGMRMETMTPRELRDARRKITMIFQGFNLLMQRNCLDNICFPLELAGRKKADARKRAGELLELVGLPDKARAYPAQLSGGQQQRVAIARALVNNPATIIADEPTGNLDPERSMEIMTLLVKINQLGTTVLVVTHEKDLVNKFGKRVITIDQGRIINDSVGGYVGGHIHE